MRLHDFKAKWIAELTLYTPRSERERELRDRLVTKIYNLRAMTLPDLLHTLYLIIEHEKNVSTEFRNLCRSIVESLSELVKTGVEE